MSRVGVYSLYTALMHYTQFQKSGVLEKERLKVVHEIQILNQVSE
jgi:hypothetical protein